MADNLMENWSETKEALVDGLTGTKKQVMETTLENTKSIWQRLDCSGAIQLVTLQHNKVIPPVIRRVMPNSYCPMNWCTVMTGPVGQITNSRVRYAETFDSATAGDEALSPSQIATGYPGNATTNRADATSTLEGTGGKKMSNPKY